MPFAVADASLFETLSLDIKYDDGFVAYVNGTEVARRNAPSLLDFNSTATTFRPDSEAVVFEEINISVDVGLLQDGANVLAIHALNHTVGGNDFLVSPKLSATDVDLNATSRNYFSNPTPGDYNDVASSFAGFVEDTKFSIDRGYYSQPISVEITSATPDALIYYTLDGTAPQIGVGSTQQYLGPLAISSTTTLRAVATKTGLAHSDIDTQTYFFATDVLNQPVNPAGFPSTWGGGNGRLLVNGDYEVDPDILAMHSNQELLDAFTTIPTIALSLPTDDLFDPAEGIYSNPKRGGERGVAVEYLDIDGEPGFALNAGIQIHGGDSISVGRQGGNPASWNAFKLSFRLEFKQRYGPTELDYQLFETSSIDSINTLVLDAYWQNSLQHNNDPFARQALYVRDILMTDLQRATGSYSTHQTYSHLYINGLYWGIYVLHERPDAAALAEHLGGERDDYDVIHNSIGDITSGTNTDLVHLVDLAEGVVNDPAQYAEIQALLDIPQFADYMLLNHWGATRDMFGNWYAGRNSAADMPFQFYAWDSELMLNNVGENEINTTRGVPNEIFQGLRNNPEFVVTYGDRAHAMLFNDGILTADKVSETMENRLATIEDVIALEYARWGDLRKPDAPYTVDDWQAERDHLNNNFFPQREGILRTQLISAGLYPSIVAPLYNQHGGKVSSGFALTMAAPSGTIYYTLDGSDPREIGGAISTSAIEYDGTPISITEASSVKSRTLAGGQWSALNDAQFTILAFADATNLRVSELHYNPADPTAAESAAGFADNDEFEFIELVNLTTEPIELQGISLTEAVDLDVENSTTIAAGERVVLVENQSAFEFRYGTSIRVIGQWSGKLSNGGELIEISDRSGQIIQSFMYEDGDDPGEESWPTGPDGGGVSLVAVDLQGNYDDGTNWQASTVYNGTPGSEELAPISGDYDRNGTVEQDDYDLWKNTFGSTSDLRADGNGNRVVDAADYTVWRDHLGQTQPLSTVSAPPLSNLKTVATEENSLPIDSAFTFLASTNLESSRSRVPVDVSLVEDEAAIFNQTPLEIPDAPAQDRKNARPDTGMPTKERQEAALETALDAAFGQSELDEDFDS